MTAMVYTTVIATALLSTASSSMATTATVCRLAVFEISVDAPPGTDPFDPASAPRVNVTSPDAQAREHDHAGYERTPSSTATVPISTTKTTTTTDTATVVAAVWSQNYSRTWVMPSHDDIVGINIAPTTSPSPSPVDPAGPGREVLTTVGVAGWIARFTPTVEGTHEYVVILRDGTLSKRGTFECLKCEHEEGRGGFVGVGGPAGQHFAFDNGTAFVPVGENVAMPDRRELLIAECFSVDLAWM